MIPFGERLRQARAQAGLSQEALAEALEKSKMTVLRWENGQAEGPPDFRQLELLSALLKVPVAWFFQTEELALSPVLAKQLAQVATQMDELSRAHAAVAAQVAALARAPQVVYAGRELPLSRVAEAPPAYVTPAQAAKPVSLPDDFFKTLLGETGPQLSSGAEPQARLLEAARKRLGVSVGMLAKHIGRHGWAESGVQKVLNGAPVPREHTNLVAAALGFIATREGAAWVLPEWVRMAAKERARWDGQAELVKLLEGVQ